MSFREDSKSATRSMTIIPEWVPVLGDELSCDTVSLQTSISKSDRDEREYRLIRLQNEMQILVISDPDADKAAASLEVCVGHLSDPVRRVDNVVGRADVKQVGLRRDLGRYAWIGPLL